MIPLQPDLSIYNKFDFETLPIGVKFLLNWSEIGVLMSLN